MMNFRLYKTVLASALSIGLTFFLVGAGDVLNDVAHSDQRPAYDFLPHLRINVASLKVIDDATPIPRDEAGLMPYTPNDLLKDLAKQRFICEGTKGEAVLNIRQASLTRHPDRYEGKIILSLTMENSGKTADLSATVYKRIAPLPEETQSETLIRLTKALLDEMNVEIEYQLRSKFPTWIVHPNGKSDGGSANISSSASGSPAGSEVIAVSDDTIQTTSLPPLMPDPAQKTPAKNPSKKGLKPLPPPPQPRSYR